MTKMTNKVKIAEILQHCKDGIKHWENVLKTNPTKKDKCSGHILELQTIINIINEEI
jgi:hypothetical protein